MSQLKPKAPQVDWDTAAYGQGVAVSPIELVSAISAIANGGVLMRPYLNAALAPTGDPARDQHNHGTASDPDDGGCRRPGASRRDQRLCHGGKDGSAYIPNPAGGGYLNELTDSYIGFGPTSDPKFIAFIRLNTIPGHLACGGNRGAGVESTRTVDHQLL